MHASCTHAPMQVPLLWWLLRLLLNVLRASKGPTAVGYAVAYAYGWGGSPYLVTLEGVVCCMPCA